MMIGEYLLLASILLLIIGGVASFILGQRTKVSRMVAFLFSSASAVLLVALAAYSSSGQRPCHYVFLVCYWDPWPVLS